MLADCVFYLDSFVCVGCLTGDEDPSEITPVTVNDEVDEWPRCEICGKMHKYMINVTERDQCAAR